MPTSVMRKRKQNSVESLINNLLDKILCFRTLFQVLFVCFLVEKHPCAQEQSKHAIFTTWCTGGQTQRPSCTEQQIIGFHLHCERARSLAIFSFGNRNGYLRGAGNKNEIPNSLCLLYQRRGFVFRPRSSYLKFFRYYGYCVQKTCFNGQRFFKKAERPQEIGTCQDSEMRRKDWIGSIKKKKEEIQRENREVKAA